MLLALYIHIGNQHWNKKYNLYCVTGVAMAGIVERFKKKNRSDSPRDWNTTGSFMNKPQRGWLHPDDQLNPDAGVVYGVRVSSNHDLEIPKDI